jgi:hypothetical protein
MHTHARAGGRSGAVVPQQRDRRGNQIEKVSRNEKEIQHRPKLIQRQPPPTPCCRGCCANDRLAAARCSEWHTKGIEAAALLLAGQEERSIAHRARLRMRRCGAGWVFTSKSRTSRHCADMRMTSGAPPTPLRSQNRVAVATSSRINLTACVMCCKAQPCFGRRT